MQRCRVAATQVDVRHMNPEHNLETHARLIAETAAVGGSVRVLGYTSRDGSGLIGPRGLMQARQPVV
jgi:hypothetical protein